MELEKRLYHFANEWEVNILALLKLAKNNGIGHAPSEHQISILRRKLSGYYDLSDLEIRTLSDFLKTEKAQSILKDVGPVIDSLDGGEQNKLLTYIAERLYAVMEDSDLKKKIKPEAIRETVMNLGVITLYRSSATSPDEEEKIPPAHLLKVDKDIAKKVIKRYLTRVLEKARDIEEANKLLRIKYEELKQYARS